MRMKKSNTHHHMYSMCENHMNQYVLAETIDGQKIDGIITGVDQEYVYLAIPTTGDSSQSYGEQYEQRQFGYGGFGYPGYGYGYGVPYGYPPRRFNRLILPLAALVALSALPWY